QFEWIFQPAGNSKKITIRTARRVRLFERRLPGRLKLSCIADHFETSGFSSDPVGQRKCQFIPLLACGVFSRQERLKLALHFESCFAFLLQSLSPDSRVTPSFLPPCFAPWLTTLQPEEFALGNR